MGHSGGEAGRRRRRRVQGGDEISGKMALIYQRRVETGADSGVRIILSLSQCEIHAKRVSGRFQRMDEQVLVNVKHSSFKRHDPIY